MFKTERLNLRIPEVSDLESLYEWENNTDLWGVSETYTPFSRTVLNAYVNSIHDIYDTKQLRLIIELKSSEIIGAVDLFEFDERNSKVGIGVLIVDEKHRDNGYAKEAINCVIQYVQKQLLLKQIYCHIDIENNASLHLFESLGFEKTGVLKSWKNTLLGFKDVVVFQKFI